MTKTPKVAGSLEAPTPVGLQTKVVGPLVSGRKARRSPLRNKIPSGVPVTAVWLSFLRESGACCCGRLALFCRTETSKCSVSLRVPSGAQRPLWRTRCVCVPLPPPPPARWGLQPFGDCKELPPPTTPCFSASQLGVRVYISQKIWVPPSDGTPPPPGVGGGPTICWWC